MPPCWYPTPPLPRERRLTVLLVLVLVCVVLVDGFVLHEARHQRAVRARVLANLNAEL